MMKIDSLRIMAGDDAAELFGGIGIPLARMRLEFVRLTGRGNNVLAAAAATGLTKFRWPPPNASCWPP